MLTGLVARHMMRRVQLENGFRVHGKWARWPLRTFSERALDGMTCYHQICLEDSNGRLLLWFVGRDYRVAWAGACACAALLYSRGRFSQDVRLALADAGRQLSEQGFPVPDYLPYGWLQ